jgi:acyl-CoA thioester hydrolase
MYRSRLILRVRYAETDQMGVAHHSSYFVWMEAARTELLRECGLSYRELEERGYLLPVHEAHCRFKKSVRYDDLICIDSWLERIGGASLRIEYRIYRTGEENRTVAEGYTLHAFTGREGRVVKTPDFFRALFQE